MKFDTQDVSEARYTWHPKVHGAFGDHCAFLLLRVSVEWPQARSEIYRILEENEVLSFGIYPLFGYYDILVRMWTSHLTVQLVAEALLKQNGLIEHLEEFNARDVDFLWWPAEVDTKNVLRHNRQIVAAATLQDSPEMLRDTASLNLLFEQNLLCASKGYDRDSVKLFILFLRSRSTNRTNRQLRDFLMNDANQLQPLSDLSFYSGLGFADLIIKAVAPRFHDIHTVVERMSELLANENIKISTLIVSSQYCVEQDRIPKTLHHQNEIFLELLTFIKAQPSDKHVRNLSEKNRIGLERLFVENQEFVQSAFSECFASLFWYKLDPSSTRLVKVLEFVPKFEFLLRDFLIQSFVQRWTASTWYNDLKQAVENSGHGNEINFDSSDKFTLAQLLRVYGSVKASEPALRRIVEVVLGPDWEKDVLRFAEIRNDFAHGRVYSPTYRLPDDDSFDLMILNVASVFIKLSQNQQTE